VVVEEDVALDLGWLYFTLGCCLCECIVVAVASTAGF
jgi:hypothetical protein